MSSDYIRKHWTVDDGLPVNEIVSIAQTHDGYIWLATFDGLIRFDGDQFTVFNSGNTPEFPTNRFVELKVDQYDNLWIVTEKVKNNELLIRYSRGQFKVFGTEDGLSGEIDLQLSNAGNLMVGCQNGGFYYDGKALHSFGEYIQGKTVRQIHHGRNDRYWFATDQGAFKLEGDQWTPYNESNGLDTNDTYAVYSDQQDRIWVASKKGLNLLENGTINSVELHWDRDVIRRFSIRENPAKPGQLFLNNDRNFLYTYEDGQFLPFPNATYQSTFEIDQLIDKTGTVWTQMLDKLYRGTELIYTASGPINELFQDQLGNLWIAQRDGLVQIKERIIRTYSQNITGVYALSEQPDGTVWATKSHQQVYELRNESFLNIHDEIGIPFPRPTYALYTSSDGMSWLGSVNGVYRWDRMSRAQLVQPPGGDPLPPMKDVKGILEDHAGNLWFGGNNGIHQWGKNGDWTHIGEIDGEAILGVRLIYMTRDSSLWFGTNGNGLLHLKEGKLSQLSTEQGLSGNIIRSVYEDKEGILWVGTEGWGLNRVVLADKTGTEEHQITVYDKQTGLFDNVIHQILEDDHGRFWMSGNRGIFWVNLAELTAMAQGEISSVYSFFYSELDGLPGREGNGGVQPTGFKSAKGELWFPMMGGVARIDPGKIQTSPLNIFLEEVSSADSILYLGDTQEMTFPRGQRDLQIRYAALDFSTSPANLRYRYQLEGYRDEWIEAGNRKEAIFNNLDPGTYTFRVMANNGGGWLVNEATLQITLPYFFYETYWFYALVALLIGLVIYLAVNWRIRMLKQKGRELEEQVVLRTKELTLEKEETERQKDIVTDALLTIEKQAAALKELDKAKSRFFTNISHEFRTPLTLIIGPLEHQIERLREGLAGDTEDMEVALRNSKRLLRLVNQILEVAKLESGHTQLNATEIDIRAVIEPITDAFMSLAERNGTHFKIEWPDEPVLVHVDIDLMEKAIINLLSNAFKFTPNEGTISVRVKQEADYISLSIKDNGPGIPKEEQEHIFERFYQVNETANSIQPGTGIGLSLVHELISLHGGTIELISEAGEGSEFLIKLQAVKTHPGHNPDIVSAHTGNDNSQETFEEGFAEAEMSALTDHQQSAQAADQPLLLIVEDNADIRGYVRKHLSTEYRIMEAENGLEGFRLTAEALPDLVISDVMMPLSDGYDLCRKIKQHPELDFIPVVLLTARAEKSMKIEGLELGADDYVIKPFEIDELKARVRNLIQSRQKLKERLATSPMESGSTDLIGWVDTPFANRVRAIIEQHIGDEDFNVVQLADTLKVGRTTLYSRVMELTGKSPSEMIKLTRLYQASQLLKEEAGNISEVAYATGFKSVSHFSKTFKAEFGVAPTQYARLPVASDKS